MQSRKSLVAMSAFAAALFSVGTAPQGRAASRPAPNASAAFDPIDYRALDNPYFDSALLVVAKDHDLSDRQVAEILKITKWSGKPFRVVLDQVANGETLPMVAIDDGVPPEALRHVGKEMEEIAAYQSAYFETGKPGQRTETIDKILRDERGHAAY